MEFSCHTCFFTFSRRDTDKTNYYRKSQGLMASGFKGIARKLDRKEPGGNKFESDAVIFRKRARWENNSAR